MEESNAIFYSQIPVSELPQYGWVDIPVHLRLSCGQTYRIVLESVDCIDFGPKISFYDAKLAAAVLLFGDTRLKYRDQSAKI